MTGLPGHGTPYPPQQLHPLQLHTRGHVCVCAVSVYVRARVCVPLTYLHKPFDNLTYTACTNGFFQADCVLVEALVSLDGS